MATDFLRLREQALEYEFFHKVDEELWRQLRDAWSVTSGDKCSPTQPESPTKQSWANSSDAQISCETLYALSLFPLVWVAWSDGSISPEQRKEHPGSGAGGRPRGEFGELSLDQKMAGRGAEQEAQDCLEGLRRRQVQVA